MRAKYLLLKNVFIVLSIQKLNKFVFFTFCLNQFKIFVLIFMNSANNSVCTHTSQCQALKRMQKKKKKMNSL